MSQRVLRNPAVKAKKLWRKLQAWVSTPNAWHKMPGLRTLTTNILSHKNWTQMQAPACPHICTSAHWNNRPISNTAGLEQNYAPTSKWQPSQPSQRYTGPSADQSLRDSLKDNRDISYRRGSVLEMDRDIALGCALTSNFAISAPGPGLSMDFAWLLDVVKYRETPW